MPPNEIVGSLTQPLKEPSVSQPEFDSPTIHSESAALVPADAAQSSLGPHTVLFLVSV